MSKKQIKTPTKKPQQDDSTMRLAYGFKKRCDFYGVIANPVIKIKLDESVEKNNFQLFHSTDEIGPMQIRAFMQIAAEVKYAHLKMIRIWKGNIGDEGVRFICKYMSLVNNIQALDLLDNNITSLGCQFLGKLLASNHHLQQLKLDNNPIQTEGLKNLAIGLRQNHTLDKLSLKYCSIEASGSKYLQQILANINSKLRSLKLQGNPFGNEGAYQVLRAVQCSESLQKINLADIKMQLLDYHPERGSTIELIAQLLLKLMSKNMLIVKYDIRFNPMHSDIALLLLKAINSNTRIRKMQFANNVNYEIRDELDTILRKRNKDKKGKKKSKK